MTIIKENRKTWSRSRLEREWVMVREYWKETLSNNVQKNESVAE